MGAGFFLLGAVVVYAVLHLVALRVIGRRSPSRSMTLVGDVAQSTTPAGQRRWSDVLGLAPIRRGSRVRPPLL